jgi:nucleotide-binding universal stress UspA family protein
MADNKDYFGEKLRLAERAREDAYFRKLDQTLIARMRQQDRAEALETVPQAPELFSSILVPVDFSAYAANAVRYACGIAERFASSIIVLHVIPHETTTQVVAQRLGYRDLPFLFVDSVPRQSAPAMPPEVAENAVIDLREQAYRALQAFLPTQMAAPAVELRVLVGHPFERILETAVQEKVGLIVLGTHGRTGLAHLIMGSVAERVVRVAPCPVLTVQATMAQTQASGSVSQASRAVSTHPE